MGSQAPGRGWCPLGAEVTGQSLGSSAMQGTLAGGEGPCPVVWRFCFGGVGSSGVTNWRVGLVEGTKKQGQEQPGGVPVKAGKVAGGTGMTEGMGWVGQWAAGWDIVFWEHTKDGRVVWEGIKARGRVWVKSGGGCRGRRQVARWQWLASQVGRVCWEGVWAYVDLSGSGVSMVAMKGNEGRGAGGRGHKCGTMTGFERCGCAK